MKEQSKEFAKGLASLAVGTLVGKYVGFTVGVTEGNLVVGIPVGFLDGNLDGNLEGVRVGTGVENPWGFKQRSYGVVTSGTRHCLYVSWTGCNPQNAPGLQQGVRSPQFPKSTTQLLFKYVESS